MLPAAPVDPATVNVTPDEAVDVFGAGILHTAPLIRGRWYLPLNLKEDQPMRSKAARAPTSQMGGL